MRKPFLRNNGIYYAIFTKKGKTVWQSLETNDPVIAEALFRSLEEERQKPKKLKLSQYSREFCERMMLERRAGTIEMYKWCVSDFIRTCGDKVLDRIGPLDGERFKQKRKQEGVRNVSINIQLKTLKTIMNDAVRMRLLKNSPFENIRFLPNDSPEAPFVSEYDLGKLLSVMPDQGFKELVKFAFYTVMRLGEIVNLPWEHVDMDRKAIHVKNYRDFRTKGKPRWVPMHPVVLEILRTLPREGVYVFPGASGARRDQDSLSKRFKRCVREAEVDQGIHFHSLRHGGMTWLSMNGVPDEIIRKIAGHRSYRTTQIYTHLDQTYAQSVMGRLPVASYN